MLRIRQKTGVLRRVAAGLGMALVMAASHADDYPSRDIRFVVPMAPGGSVDTLARLTAQALSPKLGQTIVVENRPGAGGVLATSYAARSEPDGYTVFVADTGQLAINPTLYKNLPYDATRPFVPVIEAVSTPLFLAVNDAVPARSFQELVDYARKKHGLSFGSTGIGSVHHLAMQTLATAAGIHLVHIPYKGAGPAATALAAGEVPAIFSAWPSLQGFVHSGQARILAVATPVRTPLKPDVPTIAESGIPGFDATPTVGFVLPPGTPASIAARLNHAISDVLADPALRDRLLSMGLVPMGGSPAQYGQHIQAATDLYRKVIESGKIQLD